MESRLKYTNTPEPSFEITKVHESEPRRVIVDWERIGDPEPRAFELLNAATVKLAVAGNHIGDEDFDRRATEALGEVQELLKDMADARGLDEQAAADVMMGNLEELPECSLEDAR